MNPLVSVVVPINNTEKYLIKCVNSIIAQSYKNIEIILVDDGSTDESGAILDEYAVKDLRLIVIHQKNVVSLQPETPRLIASSEMEPFNM